ncbi:MAG: GreA/GreB family elongation factor [Gaiellaceae bacterium]
MLTAAGYRDLQAELEQLKSVRRGEVASRLRQALEFAGDRGDNLDYLDALREQEEVENRIARLEAQLAAATVLEPERVPPAHVVLGSWVELEDIDTGDRSRYRLVNSPEANPTEGRLSIDSPVGRALSGRAAGDTVEVTTPHRTRRLRIAAASGLRRQDEDELGEVD